MCGWVRRRGIEEIIGREENRREEDCKEKNRTEDE
jgi:hypothetical protein